MMVRAEASNRPQLAFTAALPMTRLLAQNLFLAVSVIDNARQLRRPTAASAEKIG